MVHGLQKPRTHHTLLIGLGPHAKKVYISWLLRKGRRQNVVLKGVVELEHKKADTQSYLQKVGLTAEVISAPQLTSDKLPPRLRGSLRRFVKSQSIDSVIIATEPHAHKAYALWALETGLHVLMDKPVTAQFNSAKKTSAARAILRDYEQILKKYSLAQLSKPNLLFSVSTQRRYHVGFDIVRSRLTEVLTNTDCPVTAIQSSHGDGQWRLPEELLDIDYHGFKNGYGKMSHSGYHFFDLLSEIMRHGVSNHKKPTHAEIYTRFTTPYDQLQRMGVNDHINLFDNYNLKRSQQDIENGVKDFGELDAFSLITFKREQATLCTAQLSLEHSNFSVRSWVQPKDDLYKGNGRVKHEHHTISQGPLQTIQIHSYQAHPEADREAARDYDLGGRNHLEIYIFRNVAMIGGQAVERISVKDLIPNPDALDLLTEVVKSEMIDEFFSYLNGEIERDLLKSDLSTHRNTVALMSAAYVSGIKSQGNSNPISSIEWY